MCPFSTYGGDVMSFVKFLDLAWPDEAISLLSVSIQDVQGFRDDPAQPEN